jgi:hypothetical protein
VTYSVLINIIPYITCVTSTEIVWEGRRSHCLQGPASEDITSRSFWKIHSEEISRCEPSYTHKKTCQQKMYNAHGKE